MRSTRGESSTDELDQALIDIIRNEHPETLQQTIELARLRFSTSDEETLKRVLRLERARALRQFRRDVQIDNPVGRN